MEQTSIGFIYKTKYLEAHKPITIIHSQTEWLKKPFSPIFFLNNILLVIADGIFILKCLYDRCW
jgi:hypothetical protein